MKLWRKLHGERGGRGERGGKGGRERGGREGEDGREIEGGEGGDELVSMPHSELQQVQCHIGTLSCMITTHSAT